VRKSFVNRRHGSFIVFADRIEMIRGIRALQAAGSQARAAATVRLHGEKLSITFAGVRVVVYAAGTWPGKVTIPAESFRCLAVSLLEEFTESRLQVRAKGGRFFVGPVSCACTRKWIPLAQTFIEDGIYESALF